MITSSFNDALKSKPKSRSGHAVVLILRILELNTAAIFSIKVIKFHEPFCFVSMSFAALVFRTLLSIHTPFSMVLQIIRADILRVA